MSFDGRPKVSEPDPELDGVTRSVLAAALEVHRTLGPGFLEAAYEHALAIELALRAVAFERQVPVSITYKGTVVGLARLDLLVAGRLVVELKAAQELLPVHMAQLHAYLNASDQPLGLLINFNVRLLRQGIRRVIRIPRSVTAIGAS